MKPWTYSFRIWVRRIFFPPGSDSAAEHAPEGTFEGVISMENNVDNLENIFN